MYILVNIGKLHIIFSEISRCACMAVIHKIIINVVIVQIEIFESLVPRQMSSQVCRPIIVYPTVEQTDLTRCSIEGLYIYIYIRKRKKDRGENTYGM